MKIVWRLDIKDNAAHLVVSSKEVATKSGEQKLIRRQHPDENGLGQYLLRKSSYKRQSWQCQADTKE